MRKVSEHASITQHHRGISDFSGNATLKEFANASLSHSIHEDVGR
jgi:hypothetical protein